MGKEWINIRETGQLYLEKILVTFDFPILFVCTDFEKRRYLCLNVSENNDKYVISETDNKQLIGMLTNKITMESVFRKCLNDRLIIAEYDSESEEIISKIQNPQQISGDLLPEEGAFFELSNNIIADYIAFLKKQLVIVEHEQNSRSKKMAMKDFQSFYNTYVWFNEKATSRNGRIIRTDTLYNCSYHVNAENRLLA